MAKLRWFEIIAEDDPLLGDRGFCSYELIARVLERPAWSTARSTVRVRDRGDPGGIMAISAG